MPQNENDNNEVEKIQLELDKFPIETPIDIAKDVFKLALPAMTMNILQTINVFIDRRFIGSLGTDSIAAVGIAGQFLFLIISVAFALSTGTTALVARFWGAKDIHQAIKASRQSLVLSIAIGLIMFGLGYLLVTPYVTALEMAPEPRRLTLLFLHFVLPGIVPIFVANSISGSLRGIGDTVRPMWAMLGMIVAHITGLVFLVYHPFTNDVFLGLSGAAIASLASQYVGMIFLIIMYLRKGLAGGIGLEWLNFDWAKRILRIAIPAAFQAFLRISSLMVFTIILNKTPDHTAAVAALTVGMVAEGIAFMPGFGYSIAASALVGQNLGAKRPDRAEKIGWGAMWQGILLMSFMGALFFIFAEQFARFFVNDNPRTIAVTIDYLRIAAISEPFLAVGMILTGALQGAGDTFKPTLVTFISFWVIRIPLALLLAVTLGWGARGSWWAMTTSTILSGVMTYWLFKSGHWKKVKV